MAHYADRINTAPRTLSNREQRLLLKTTGEHRKGFRDHIIIATAFATGLRSHELLVLDVGDVFGPDGLCRRRLQLRVFKRSNDDLSAQQVVLSDSLRAKLDKLLRWKQAKGEGVAPEAPLFVSQNGNRLSGRQLRERFAQWQEMAGIDRPVSVHGQLPVGSALPSALRASSVGVTSNSRGTRQILECYEFSRSSGCPIPRARHHRRVRHRHRWSGPGGPRRPAHASRHTPAPHDPSFRGPAAVLAVAN